MVIDLLIRGRSGGKRSLDDVMREMYEEFYVKSSNNSYYLRGRGYQPEDLQRVASKVAGFDFQDFFDRYVRSTQTLPYDEAFAFVGLRVNKVTRLADDIALNLSAASVLNPARWIFSVGVNGSFAQKATYPGAL